MGLPAATAAGQTPRTGDVMIVGYFESIDEGSAAKRVVLGFGSGGAELKTQVEGYLMTDQGPRELGLLSSRHPVAARHRRGRSRATERPLARRVLHAAHGRGKRDDAKRHFERLAPAPCRARSARGPAPGSRPDEGCNGGDHPLVLSGRLLQANRRRGHEDRRSADRKGRASHPLVPVRKS